MLNPETEYPKPPGLSVIQQTCWEHQEAVIQAYQTRGTLGKAAQDAQVDPNTAYGWSKLDTLGFNARMEAGYKGYRDHLEAMVEARLSDPTGNRGSDVLLMGALNANHPDKWSRNIQVTHEVGREVMSTLRAIQEQQQAKPAAEVLEHEPWKQLGDGAADAEAGDPPGTP